MQDALELSEEDFLGIAREVFARKENALVPILIHLLENLGTEKAIQLLEELEPLFFMEILAHIARIVCAILLALPLRKSPDF